MGGGVQQAVVRVDAEAVGVLDPRLGIPRRQRGRLRNKALLPVEPNDRWVTATATTAAATGRIRGAWVGDGPRGNLSSCGTPREYREDDEEW